MKKFDIIVIGAGPAGLSAAKYCSKQGYKTLLIERDERLGGILNQCIHNGFGLKLFKEELTGPEYITKMLKGLKNDNLTILTNSFVTKIDDNLVEVTNATGVKTYQASAIIVATGARERTAGQISLLGDRPSGIWTAGFAQKMINHHGKLVGKNAVILGSGDIGLILARRLKYEGANVVGIYEINKTSAGLMRNIVQCVEDFNIPLYYSSTIVEVVGQSRVEGVYVCQVDKDLNPILETKKFVKCDCVLLSVGLIPEIDLIKDKIQMFNASTPQVNQFRQTSLKSIFVCGNSLHIHDLADNASIEGEIAARGAIDYIKNNQKNKTYSIKAETNVSYVMPQTFSKDDQEFTLFFRVKSKIKNGKIVIKNNSEIIFERFLRVALPGQMQEVILNGEQINSNISICIEGGETC